MRLSRQVLLLFITVAFIECNDKDREIPDPCLGKTAFQADFTMQEAVGDTSFVTQKILAPGYLVLKAQGEYDSVKWYVGNSQNTSTDLKYTLYFNTDQGEIDIEFIGYQTPDGCFPDDRASDTVRKIIQVIKRDANAAIVGKFRGYNQSNPSDTFSVSITHYDDVWGYFLKNLPKGCSGYTAGVEGFPSDIGIDMAAGYSSFMLNASTRACSIIKGYGRLISGDTLSIDYSYYPRISSNPLSYESISRKEKFIGVRQP